MTKRNSSLEDIVNALNKNEADERVRVTMLTDNVNDKQ